MSMGLNTLQRYIARTVITYTLLVLLLLAGINSFIEFVNELRDIGINHYGLLQVLLYVPMLMPDDLYQIFPMAGLLGVMIGLGRLANETELVAMRAAGMSIGQITRAVLKAALIMLVVAVLIGEWAGPEIEKFAQKYKAIAMNNLQVAPESFGVWLRQDDNFFHIDAVKKDKTMVGITRYQFNDKHQLLLASTAAEARYINKKWEFEQVRQTQFMANSIKITNFAEQAWEFNYTPHMLLLMQINPAQSSLVKLYRYINYKKESGISATEFEYIFWKRIFRPLAILIMITLALPFVFGPLRSATMGLRILIGVVLGFSFYILNEFFGTFAMVYQLSPLFTAAVPTLLFGFLAVLMPRLFKYR